MSYTALLILVMAIYFIAMILISLVGRKKASSFDDYLDAGKSCGVLLMIGGQVGSHIGNGVVVGGASEGAAVGIGGALYGVACGISCLMVALVVCRLVDKHGYRSSSEYFRGRYNGKSLPLIFALANVFGDIGLIGGQLMAGKALFEALDLNGTLGLISIAFVVFLYSQIAGIWGSMATSVVQTAIILFALLFAGVFLLSNGAIDTISAAVASGTIPESFVHFTQAYPFDAALLTLVPVSMSALIDTGNVQRVNSAKTRRKAEIAHYISFVLVALIAAIPVFMGLYARAAYGLVGNAAFFTVVIDIMHPLLSAIVLTAVVAAVMSTIDCLYIIIAQCLLNDIYVAYINPSCPEEKLRKATLPINIIVTTAAAITAMQFDSIVNLLSSALSFMTSTCLVPFIGGLVWSKGNSKGATVCAFIGLALQLLEFFGIYSLPYSGITIILPGLIAYIAISLLTTEDKTAAEA